MRRGTRIVLGGDPQATESREKTRFRKKSRDAGSLFTGAKMRTMKRSAAQSTNLPQNRRPDAVLSQSAAEPALPRDAATSDGVRTDVVKGTLLGILSAVGYSAANVGLRDLSETKGLDWAIFIAAAKAIPCFLAAWTMVLFRRSRGRQSLPAPGKRLPLLGAALMMQFGGNMMFVWSLSLVGLVLTIPLTFASLILGSAVLGRVFLNEPIEKQMLISIALVLLSISCLSYGAPGSLPAAGWPTILLGLGTALLAGFSYGANSIVIRRFVGSDHSVSSVIVVMSTTGVCVLGTIGAVSVGADRIAAIPASQWQVILLAGICNAIAFFSVCSALRFIPAVRANVLNASQTAMCALAGVALFHEQVTLLIAFGISATIAGLMVLGIRRAPQRGAAPISNVE